MSLEINSVFDKVAVYLVFGLPQSKDGNKGILVIVDFVSKYPYAKPIKSKTMNEIAMLFYEYITMFGPPREIMSDQGKEFVNSLLREINQISGTKHSTTSSYFARSNGQAEIMNKNIMNVLRK